MDYNRPVRKKRGKKRKRRILKRLIPMVVAVVAIAIVLVVAIATGTFENLSYSTKEADLFEYYQVPDEDVAVVVADGDLTDRKLKVIDGFCYMDLATVKDEMTDRFYYDVNANALLYTTATQVISATVSEKSYTKDGQAVATPYTICLPEGDSLLVALDYVKLYKNFSMNLFGGNGEPYRVEIKTVWEPKQVATLKKDQAVRKEEDKRSLILKSLKKGDSLTIVEKGEEWTKVETDDLIVGYIETKRLTDFREEAVTPVTEVAEEVFENQVRDKKIVLAWDLVTNQSANSGLSDKLAGATGLNVISPTWFSLADNNGTVSCIASTDYVTLAHEKGLEVWGLIDNMTYPEVSSYEVLSYQEKRKSVIDQLMAYAAQYQLEGINVDFESLSGEAGEPFIQFIRELSIACRQNKLVLSVDNYVPEAYTDHYNRKEQGIFADYVIIMGYDEHYSGSKEAGSVASIGYVTHGIEKTLEEVPAQKVINALPLYSRIWIETPKTEAELAAEDPNSEYIAYNLDVQTVGMDVAINTAKQNATPVWDEETAQNYAEWTKNGSTYKVWLEDEQSLSAKIQVMNAHAIGGAAVWQIGYGTEEAWRALSQFQ